MRTYRRIAYEDRCQLYALRKVGKTPAEIGQALGVSQGTSAGNWLGMPDSGATAFSKRSARRGPDSSRSGTSRVRRAIARKLRAERWSPEQLSFWFAGLTRSLAQHEWIYQLIWANKRMGGALWRFLRRRGKRYNRRGAPTGGRGMIPYRIDIADRPAIVAAKSRLGDWEGDPIVGARHQGGPLTHVERTSRFTTISKLSRPPTQATHRATVYRLNPFCHHVHTITYDNGKEFAGHRKTAQCLQAHVFFATPYHAWERGVNENTNGLIRDFFSKGTDVSTIHPATVAKVERLLNRRPRKSLGFQTPNEVFHALAKWG